MTITYTAQVATCKHLGCFWKLLFRWKGSIYKLLWLNMLVYIVLFMSVKFAYLYLMDDDLQRKMVTIGQYCHAFEETIPLSFLLGFYVAIVIARWWEQYLSIPWPDGLAVLVSVFITGQDVRARVMRRTIMRYANLSLVMTFTMVSPFIKRRFPNYQSYVDAGLLLPSENQRFKELEKRTNHPKHWVPLVWAIAIVSRARREGKIADDVSKETIITEINSFRGTCGSLLNYDWISIPLVYPQVVSWAVYSYFGTTIVSYQFPVHSSIENEKVVMSIPIFPMLQFFFYMGWLLVAETLANPFGEDDDDFDIGWLIDRNLQVSYCIADEMHNTHPELLKDQYWDDVLPPDLPWNPHTDIDEPETSQNFSKRSVTKAGDQRDKKGSKWQFDTETPVNFAKADFVSRSLDFGSERVIRVYLPPSMSRITFGSRTTNRSGMSRGSRPSGDSKIDHLPPREFTNDIKITEARTRLFQDQRLSKENNEHHFRANSESRAEEDNEIERGTDSKFDYRIEPNDNFIFLSEPRQRNPVMNDLSSRNLFSVDQNTTAPPRVDSNSSYGLSRLLSENVIRRAIVKDGSENKEEDFRRSETTGFDDSIIIEETSKVSKIDRISRMSRSRSLRDDTTSHNERLARISVEEEKSVHSVDRITSLTTGLVRDLDQIEESVVKFMSQEENVHQVETLAAFMTEQSQNFDYLRQEQTTSLNLVPRQDDPGPSNSRHSTEFPRLQSSKSSTSKYGSRESLRTTDLQAISDILFDHILREEMSKSKQDRQIIDEPHSDTRAENKTQTEDLSMQEGSTNWNLNLMVELDREQLGHEPEEYESHERILKEVQTLSNDSDTEFNLLLTEDLSDNERTIFKSASEEFYEAAIEESIDNEETKDNDNYDKSLYVFEVLDQLSYNITSENYDIHESTPIIEGNFQDKDFNVDYFDSKEDSYVQTEDNQTQDKSTVGTSTLNSVKVVNTTSKNENEPGCLTASDPTYIPTVALPEGTAEEFSDEQPLVTPPEDTLNEFRDKVEQSLAFKYCTLSPPQPRISTLYQHPAPLSTIIELPEETDSEVE